MARYSPLIRMVRIGTRAGICLMAAVAAFLACKQQPEPKPGLAVEGIVSLDALFPGDSADAAEKQVADAMRAPEIPLSDPSAQYVTEAVLRGEQFWRELIGNPLGGLIGAATTNNAEGADILVASWWVDSLPGASRVTLWDDPRWNWYVVEVVPAVVSSASATGSFLSAIQTKGPEIVGRVRLNGKFGSPIDGITATGGAYTRWDEEISPKARKIVTRPPRRFQSMLYVADSKRYVIMRIDKSCAQHLYPVGTAELGERFPPLAQKIQPIATPELIRKLNRGIWTAPHFDYPVIVGLNGRRGYIAKMEWPVRNRGEELVVDELLARKLSSSEFDRLLMIDASGRSVSEELRIHRLELVLWRIRATGWTKDFEPDLHRIARHYVRYPGTDQRFPKTFFANASYTRTLDFSAEALLWLKQEKDPGPSLEYLGYCGRTPEALDQLKATVLAPEFQKKKEDVIDSIQRQIALDRQK